MNAKILIAGFGGQGILFAGKFLVYAGMIGGAEVSWLPSYGPEMRGGTANCSVIFSDSPIGSPIVDTPDILVAMNLPSLDKFEPTVRPGGQLFIDSALITRPANRSDIETHYIPATRLAEELGLQGLANMIMIGRVLEKTGLCPPDIVTAAMKKVVPERKKALLDKNLEAIETGRKA
ncbi:MAG: 2-oxoacid:acceptor oxidoreductase family protein [Oscillospiraceae bacterium]|jgi:2-oxoglutarate ferredoxin oxidoreductase subunit gamma|nr:2-oxoacid:acceptor oxidoreductase family protein [Oscillospiraceae bacterium]